MTTSQDRRSIQKTLLGIALGFIGVELLIRLLGPVLGPPLEYFAPVAQAKVTQLERLAAADAAPEMIFIGSSTVVEGIDVAAFEAGASLDAYNAALNGADTHIMRRFVLEEIVPRVEPSAVVYGVSPGAFTEDSPHAEQYDRAPATSLDQPSLVERMARYLYMYRYRNTLRDPLTINTFVRAIRNRSLSEGIVERVISDLTTDGDAVNRSQTGGLAGPIAVPPITDEVQPEEVPSDAKADIVGMVNELEAQDIGFAFIIMPTAEPQPGFAAAVHSLGEELEVPVLDARRAIDSTEYFYDGVHLNADGAARVGSFLAGQLRVGRLVVP